MKRKISLIGSIIILAILLVALLLIFHRFVNPNDRTIPKEIPSVNVHVESGKNYCQEESREGGYCIEVYQPVCGWVDSKKIQCIKYPCAQEYSNSCFACQDEKVEYWTEGECPK